jgi:hypothetical protein
MDRTLFSPAMIETFRVCRRAYWFAFQQNQPRAEKTSVVLKRFLLKAVADILKGKVSSLPQVQKYLGAHWPSDEVSPQDGAKAFLFAYKVLSYFLSRPYRPKKANLVAVNLKVRARVAPLKIYLEDTFDAIYWHPEEKRLEFVDFHLHNLKPFDPNWPTSSILIKQFLAEKLRMRWPFEKLSLTFCQLGASELKTVTMDLDEALFRLHWPDLLKTVEEMRSPQHFAPHQSEICNRCDYLASCQQMGSQVSELTCHHFERRISRTA